MPSITLAVTDDQFLMLEWAATSRRTPIDQLIADALQGFLTPLAQRFKDAHKVEIIGLLGQLSPADQVSIVKQIKALVQEEP